MRFPITPKPRAQAPTPTPGRQKCGEIEADYLLRLWEAEIVKDSQRLRSAPKHKSYLPNGKRASGEQRAYDRLRLAGGTFGL